MGLCISDLTSYPSFCIKWTVSAAYHLSGFWYWINFIIHSVFGSKEEARGWRKAHKAEKGPWRIHKDVRSMLNRLPHKFVLLLVTHCKIIIAFTSYSLQTFFFQECKELTSSTRWRYNFACLFNDLCFLVRVRLNWSILKFLINHLLNQQSYKYAWKWWTI